MPAVYTIENMPANQKVWNAHILVAWGERAGDFCLPTQACFLTDCKKQFCPLPCFLIWVTVTPAAAAPPPPPPPYSQYFLIYFLQFSRSHLRPIPNYQKTKWSFKDNLPPLSTLPLPLPHYILPFEFNGLVNCLICWPFVLFAVQGSLLRTPWDWRGLVFVTSPCHTRKQWYAALDMRRDMLLFFLSFTDTWIRKHILSYRHCHTEGLFLWCLPSSPEFSGNTHSSRCIQICITCLDTWICKHILSCRHCHTEAL